MKRARLEIIRDILKIVFGNKDPIRITPLLRKSNLSYPRFSEYLEELLEKNFLIESNDRKGNRSLILTQKGRRYLEQYNTILKFIEEFDL